MSFIKILVLCMVPLMALAEVEFSVSMPAGTAPSVGAKSGSNPEDEQSAKISQLKFMGVSQWLQGYLGERYTQYDKWITSDFAEKYVLDYKVGKATDGSMEIAGHLDVDSLKRWVRTMDTKAHGGTSKLKVMYVLSSSLPGLSLSPADTGTAAKDTAFGQISATLAAAQFKSYNSTPVPVGTNFPSTRAPANSGDISTLSRFASQTGSNVVLWTHLLPCAMCGGMRLDFYLYNALGDRLVTVDSEDIALSVSEATSAEKLTPAMAAAYQNFRKDLDDAVASGKLFAEEFFFRIEGIENYRAFKVIDQELPKQDHVTEVVVRKTGKNSAEFSFLSTRTLDELAQRFQQIEMGAFRLKLVRVDSRTLVMRYLG